MSSWPFLFAAALAIWLLLKGPAAKTPLFVQIVCRIAIVFFAYCGVLYLLKWDPFWKWMLSTGFMNRNTAEGFLILISTLFWIVFTLRILLRGFRISGARAVALESPGPRRETTRQGLTLTDWILWYFSFHRK
jgi:hypothetical protein